MKLTTTKRLERLHERYMNGGLDRRSFLGLTAAAAAATGLSLRWAPSALAAVQEVRFDGWGGVVPPGDAAAAAVAIGRLLSDGEQTRCRAALARSRPSWTWSRVAEPLLAALPELPRVARRSLLPAALRAALALRPGSPRGWTA